MAQCSLTVAKVGVGSLVAGVPGGPPVALCRRANVGPTPHHATGEQTLTLMISGTPGVSLRLNDPLKLTGRSATGTRTFASTCKCYYTKFRACGCRSKKMPNTKLFYDP